MKIYIRFSNGFMKEVETIQDGIFYAESFNETNYELIFR